MTFLCRLLYSIKGLFAFNCIYSGKGRELRVSSFMLRLLALLCMAVDHAGLALFPNIGAFRCVGRVAFPIYCFLLTQGFLHTRDLRAYARRLTLFAILSEIPFDLLIFGRIVCGVEQNALFSLLLGLLALYGAHTLKHQPLPITVYAFILCLIAMITRVSFGWLSIALCLCFYYFRDSKPRMALCAGLILSLYTLSLRLSGVALSWVLVSLCALFSLPVILLYNKKRGPRAPLLTFLFYSAYPLHIAALVLIRALRIVPPYFF